MAIELKQQLRLTQQLVMTPQLQQAIKLLQLTRLELVNLVQQELQENPVLEENDLEDETPRERDDATLEARGDVDSQDGARIGRGGVRAASDGEGESPSGAASEDPPSLPSSGSRVRRAQPGRREPDRRADEASPTDAEKIADIDWESYLESHPLTGLDTKNTGDDERPSLEATSPAARRSRST